MRGLAHVLKWMGWSLTDVNGILGRGQMFVCLAASGWGRGTLQSARDSVGAEGLGVGGRSAQESEQ